MASFRVWRVSGFGELLADLADRAGTHGDDEVTRLELGLEVGDAGVKGAKVVGTNAIEANGVGELGTRDCRLVLIGVADEVDVSKQHLVSVGECCRELLEQQPSARGLVRLEGTVELAGVEPRAEGAERGPDLGGVVGVVVDDGRAVVVAKHLHPAIDAGEPLNHVECSSDFGSDGNGCCDGHGRVQQVVAAGHVEMQLDRPQPVDVHNGLGQRVGDRLLLVYRPETAVGGGDHSDQAVLAIGETDQVHRDV